MELLNTILEWAGINVLAAQIMSWLTANGALGLLILGVAGVIVVFLAGAVIIHKLDRIPITIPYARVLVPAALVMAMLILLIVVVVGAVMYVRDGPGQPSVTPPHTAAERPVTSGTVHDPRDTSAWGR